MAVNKVIYNDETLIDLTSDTVTEDTLLEGTTAHNAAGNRIVGKTVVPTKTSQLENDSGFINKAIIPNELNSKFAVSSSLEDLTANMVTTPINGASTGRIRGIAYGNGKFIAVDQTGKAQYSEDNGNTWTLINSFTSNPITSVTYGKGMFACIDYIANGGNVYKSYDGLQWELVYIFTSGLESITYANGRFTLVGEKGLVAFSDDLSSFTQPDTGTTNNLIGITYGQNKYIAVSSTGQVIYSLDGINWQDCSTEGDTTHYRVAAYGKGTFVIGGRGTTNGVTTSIIKYSHDGLTWHTASNNSSKTTSYVRSLAYYNGKFFAALQQGEIWTSIDGITWQVNLSTSAMWAIACGNDIVLVGGESGLINRYDLNIEWLDYEPELKSSEVLWQKQYLTLSDGTIVESEVEVHTNMKNIYDTTLNGKIGVEHVLTTGNTVAGRTVLFNKEFSVDELPFAEGYVPLITAKSTSGVGVGIYLQLADGTKSIHVMQCYGSPAYPLETLMRNGEWFSTYYTFDTNLAYPIRELIDNASSYFKLVDLTVSLKQTISNLNLSLEETKQSLDDCWSYLYDKADRSEIPTKLSDLEIDIEIGGSGDSQEVTVITIGQNPNYPVSGDGVSYDIDLSANGKYLIDLSHIHNEGGEAYVYLNFGYCKGTTIGKLMNATAPKGLESIMAGFPDMPSSVTVFNQDYGNLYYVEVEDYCFRFYGQYSNIEL